MQVTSFGEYQTEQVFASNTGFDRRLRRETVSKMAPEDFDTLAEVVEFRSDLVSACDTIELFSTLSSHRFSISNALTEANTP